MPGDSPEFAGGGGAFGFARGAHTGGEEPANVEFNVFQCLYFSNIIIQMEIEQISKYKKVLQKTVQ